MGNSESKRVIQYPQKKLKSVEIFSSSRKGDGSMSIKEISSIAYYLFDSCHFIAIYDGYGHYGGAAAFDARDALLAYFEEKRHLINQVTSSKDIKLFIAEGIAYVHQKLSKEKIYAQSGTCCIGALILQSKMYIFNVGNSRAALCTKVIMSGFKTIELSRDHNLNSLEERTRVLNKGLKVHRITENGKEEGPERAWIDENGPGITTTRGLGGWQASKGIIPEPEIEEYDLNSEDVFLVLGSDGLWDVLGTEEVTGMLFEKKREKETVETLVKEAQRRWRTVAQKEKYCVGDDPADGPRTDDITAVVCYFNFPTAEDMEKLNRFDFLFENKQARLQSLKEKMEK